MPPLTVAVPESDELYHGGAGSVSKSSTRGPAVEGGGIVASGATVGVGSGIGAGDEAGLATSVGGAGVSDGAGAGVAESAGNTVTVVSNRFAGDAAERVDVA
jgi:hypothetical protein